MTWVQHQISIPASFYTILTAYCPANTYAVSGACGIQSSVAAQPQFTVNYSGPDFDNHLDSQGRPTTWLCRLTNTSSNSQIAIYGVGCKAGQ